MHGLQAVNSVANSFHTGEGAKFQKTHPKTAAAIAAVPLAIIGGIAAGPAATTSFLGNELKDEALSQATGGLSDVVDITKAGTKLLKEGASFLNKADFDALPTEGTINPKSIKFSQNNIKDDFSDGKSFESLINGLKDGSISQKDIPAIRIVEKDGKIFSLDNRRLNAFQEAGVDISFKKLDNIPRKEHRKFSTKNEGESIEIRKRKNN